jgi:subtilisin family serine protease
MERRLRATQYLFRSGIALFLLLTGLVVVRPAPAETASPQVSAPAERLPAKIRDLALQGPVRVIVELNVSSGGPQLPEGKMSGPAVAARRARIAGAQGRALGRLQGLSHRVLHQFRSVPYMALEVDSQALTELSASPDVSRVFEDRLLRPSLMDSVPLIGADLAWQYGYDGTGQVVAIIDSGVDKAHPFLANKVVAEACFSSRGGTGTIGDCPNGQDTQIGSGAGVPCEYDLLACSHGTHVAGIAAGNGDAMGVGFSGVAKGASLMAVQVFHSSVSDCLPFFESIPCARAFTSDIGAGLEFVYDMRTQYAIAAANMSLGGDAFSSTCDDEDPQITAMINNLRSVGIPTTVAAGNDGEPASLAFPACISSAVAVGSTTKEDEVSYFSDMSPQLALLAPGSSILSSVPGGSFDVYDGTSMAAPHVAGAWAILKQAMPAATVDQLLTLFEQTGVPITDTRYGTGITKPRIDVAAALDIQYPVPVLDSISPTTTPAWGPDLTLTVNGSSFARASKVQVNGVNRATTYVSDTMLTAVVPSGDLATPATSLSITVLNPAPGGGTSVARTLTLTQPLLAVSPSTVQGGDQVTVTLTNAPGGAKDWLAFVAVGTVDGPGKYPQWVYVGAGITTRTWTVTAPSTPGQYEFRFFPNDTYVRAAYSPPVTVTAPPAPTLAVSATTVQPGGSVTVTLSSAPGGAKDWLGFATVSAPDGSGQYLQWVYVGAGITTRTWTVTVPTTPGQYQFRFFLNDSYTRTATSPTVTVPAPPPPPPGSTPALAVSATTVQPGGSVTVTLTNGPGGAKDWLAFVAVGTVDGPGQYPQWVYVGAGTTTRTWTVTVPSTPGQYEFRFFLNDSYTRAATSPTVTVPAPPPPPPGSIPTLAVSPSTALPGGSVTVTLTNGLGGAKDWLGFVAVGTTDGPGKYPQWTYVGAGVTSRTWTVTAPTTPGQYEFRYFPNDSYTRLASSPPVTVLGPTLTVSATTVAPGGQVTVTLTNSPGGAQDWLALAAVGAPSSSYLQWTYVGAGVTSRTWTVTMPTASGQYEFRLFLNNVFTLAATSPKVTVAP